MYVVRLDQLITAYTLKTLKCLDPNHAHVIGNILLNESHINKEPKLRIIGYHKITTDNLELYSVNKWFKLAKGIRILRELCNFTSEDNMQRILSYASKFQKLETARILKI